MATTTKRKQYPEYSMQYAKDHLKRVPLDLTLDFYEEVKNYASSNGESLNGFIKRAIQEAMCKDNDNR